jgi:hypothetical protein
VVVMTHQDNVDPTQVCRVDRWGDQLAGSRAPAEEVPLAGGIEGSIGQDAPTAELDERSRSSDVGEPGVGHAQKSRGHPPGWSRLGWSGPQPRTSRPTPRDRAVAPGEILGVRDVGGHIADAVHHRRPIALRRSSRRTCRKANAQRDGLWGQPAARRRPYENHPQVEGSGPRVRAPPRRRLPPVLRSGVSSSSSLQ